MYFCLNASFCSSLKVELEVWFLVEEIYLLSAEIPACRRRQVRRSRRRRRKQRVHGRCGGSRQNSAMMLRRVEVSVGAPLIVARERRASARDLVLVVAGRRRGQGRRVFWSGRGGQGRPVGMVGVGVVWVSRPVFAWITYTEKKINEVFVWRHNDLQLPTEASN